MQIQDPKKFRENIRAKLQEKIGDDILQTIAKQRNLEIPQIITNIEKGVFNYTIQECTFRKLVKKWENTAFVQIYLDRLRTVFNNIDTPTVQSGLVSGEITPQHIAFMTHQEYEPEKWRQLIEKKTKRDASKYDKKVGASTAMFTCSRCKSKNCTYYEMQTRSADEPATIFITCLNCDKHWRI